MNTKEFKKMEKSHTKKLVEIAKETHGWDYGWSFDFMIEHLKFMKDYYESDESISEGGGKENLEIINNMLKEYESYECLQEEERKEIAKQLELDYEKIENNIEFEECENEHDDMFGKITKIDVLYKNYPPETQIEYFGLVNKAQEQHFINFIELLKDDFRKLWD